MNPDELDEFEDIMDVDLSHSSVKLGGKKEERIETDPKDIPDPLNLIPEPPLKQFRVNYYINEIEPIELEAHVKCKAHGVVSSVEAHRKLIKLNPKYRDRPHMLIINYVQEEVIDNEKQVGWWM
jgi:hypothetical protein